MGHKNYQSEYDASLQTPDVFWQEKAKDIAWQSFPEKIFSHDSNGHDRWFAGGVLNTCELALDHHVKNGRGQQAALIFDSPVTGTKKTYTYTELLEETAVVAGSLAKLGVTKGDRVVIYMPMVPQAVMAMLACARLGAIHSVVFGGFAAHELAMRIEDAEPKVILTASCGIEVNQILPYKPLVDRAIQESRHKPSHVVYLQRPQLKVELSSKGAVQEHDWAEWISPRTKAEPVAVQAWDPLYILYTSGTTGKPKGIVRDNGGHAVALKYSMEAIYGMKAGDIFWAASDVGWVVGHSYIVYAPLFKGCTTVMFEGKPIKTPDAGAFWRMIEEYKINALFCAPTAFRAIRKEDPSGALAKSRNLKSLRTLFLAGERLDGATYEWAHSLLKIPVVDNWWQTETGWPMVANMTGVESFPPKLGSATKAVCGYDIQVVDDDGHALPLGKEGALVVKRPMPPGCFPTLWKDEERFQRSYLDRYPGFYSTADGGFVDKDGYVFVLGRIDDVINVAGHRLSTGEMEEIIARNPAVAECAVIGIDDELRGQLPMALVVLKENMKIPESELEAQLVAQVRDQIGAIACFKRALVVARLPKTRSGKILRATMRKIAEAQSFNMPSTIEDPKVLDEIRDCFIQHKIGKCG